MTVSALPIYKKLGLILSFVLVCCYIFVLVLFGHPIQCLLFLLPLLGVCLAAFVPSYLDQNGVVYRIEDDGIRLIRNGQSRKFIRFETIKRVQNHRGAIILCRKGFMTGSQLLYPASQVSEFASELETKMRNKPLG